MGYLESRLFRHHITCALCSSEGLNVRWNWTGAWHQATACYKTGGRMQGRTRKQQDKARDREEGLV